MLDCGSKSRVLQVDRIRHPRFLLWKTISDGTHVALQILVAQLFFSSNIEGEVVVVEACEENTVSSRLCYVSVIDRNDLNLAHLILRKAQQFAQMLGFRHGREFFGVAGQCKLRRRFFKSDRLFL